MRLYSTRESAQAGELTWLAVAECILSAALYVAIAMYLHTLHYLALAIGLAPLALLRTEAAVSWALNKYAHHSALGQRLLLERAEYKKWGPIRLVPYMFLVYTLLIVWGFIYRIVSVGYWAVREPLLAIRQMPSNWLRQALCVDLCTPPEIVPGEDTYRVEIEVQHVSGSVRRVPLHSSMPTFRKVFLGAKDPAVAFMEKQMRIKPTEPTRDWRVVITRSAFALLLFAPAFLVPMAYRISLKATCLVYAPFVWVAELTAGTGDPLKLRLERIVKGEFEKVRRGLAAIVLLTATVKVILDFGWIGVTEATHEVLFGSAKLVARFLEPKLWTWWEIVLICDALVTFGLFWSADAVLSRIIARRKGYNTRRVADIFAAATFLRAASAVAVIVYFVWLAGTQLLPHYARL